MEGFIVFIVLVWEWNDVILDFLEDCGADVE
jgi:hypothetical protein